MSRHLVRVSGRHVHYRRSGEGPPLLLLPATNSARPVMRYVRAYASSYSVLLFDTPGYGLSDPLPLERPDVGDYADALAATMDVLGIGHCGVLGSHGGATFALALADRHPDRVAALVVDEHPAYTAGEVEDMLGHYLPPFVPQWNGVHLADFWLRYREQAVFRPWNRPSKDHRIAGDVRDLEYIQDVCTIQFGAGAGYPAAYVASLSSDGVAASRRLRMPAIFAHRRDDIFLQALRATQLPAACTIDVFSLDEAERRYATFFAAHLDGVAPFSPLLPETAERDLRKDVLRLRKEEMVVRIAGRPRDTALLLLPRLPGGAWYLETLMRALGDDHFMIAPDLPGNGDSEATRPPSIAGYVELLIAALDQLGVSRCDVLAHNAGAAVAVALAQARRDRVRRVILAAPPLLDAEERKSFALLYPHSIVPREDGAHLLALWRAFRNEQLFWPWFDERPEAIRRIEPDLDPRRLNDRVVDALKQYRSHREVGEVALSFPLLEALRAPPVPTLVAAAPGDVFAETVMRGERLLENVKFVKCLGNLQDQVALLRDLIVD